MRLVLLDIDGTLLSANGAGRRAICAALRELAGSDRGADTCRFDGKTDPQIFGEILGAQGRAARDGEIDRLSTRYLELLGAELADPRYPSQPLPGARELVAALAARTDVIVGLLTGNLFEGAQRKLVAAGFHTGDFAVGAYGSDHATREALVPIALQRLAIRGIDIARENVAVVGDTPRDIACARPHGARAVAVATGSYSIDELRDADIVLADLSDLAGAMAAILDAPRLMVAS